MIYMVGMQEHAQRPQEEAGEPLWACGRTDGSRARGARRHHGSDECSAHSSLSSRMRQLLQAGLLHVHAECVPKLPLRVPEHE